MHTYFPNLVFSGTVYHQHTVVLGLLVPIAHCTLQSLMVSKVLEPWSSREFQWQLAREPPQFQYYDNLSDCSVQCANGTGNRNNCIIAFGLQVELLLPPYVDSAGLSWKQPNTLQVLVSHNACI